MHSILTQSLIGYEGGNNPLTNIAPLGHQVAFAWFGYNLNRDGKMAESLGKNYRDGLASWPQAIVTTNMWARGGMLRRDLQYKPGSIMLEALQASSGGMEVEAQIRRQLVRNPSQTHFTGAISTRSAFVFTVLEPWNGAQAQVGAFTFYAHRNGSTIDIHAVNKITRNSLYLHLGIPDAQYGKPMGTVTQHFYWSMRAQ